jgi:hypothetical protein
MPSGVTANNDAVHFAAALKKNLSICWRANTG